MMHEDDYMLISGIQHFEFCRRQWALIHVEAQWVENELTVAGQIMHEKAHNPFITEKRGDLIITREMPIFSHTLKTRGKCDVVEFHRDDDGVSLFGREGLWLPCPVEYKRGKPKVHDADRLRLCAQAICLEEMLTCEPIEKAYLYYGEIKQREPIELTTDLRSKVRTMFAEMMNYYSRGYTPRSKSTKACNSCSMKNICLPKMPEENSVVSYIRKALVEGDSNA